MKPTLVFVKAHYVNGRLAHYPGDEVAPNTFSQETINRALDEGYLAECDSADRPSLYHLFYRFTGATPEQPLTKEQLDEFCLPK
jgi:hypothetical protein